MQLAERGAFQTMIVLQEIGSQVHLVNRWKAICAGAWSDLGE